MKGIGVAGMKSESTRSDCWVRFQSTRKGGVKIRLNSRVGVMYGRSILKLCDAVLSSLEIKNGVLTLEDYGALPPVIAARIEAAVKRALPGIKSSHLPDMLPHCTYETRRERFRRSRLYLPGNEPKFFLNAGIHRPDGIILDLEDSVAPSEKDTARILVRNVLRQVNFYGCERMVRINQLPEGLKDLEEVAPHNVHVILIPKCEEGSHVAAVDKKLKKILTEHKVKKPVYLMPIVESALGAIKAYDIATASKNVVALTIGLEDYTADIGADRTLDGRESLWARSQVVNAARAGGVQPIDTVFSDVADMAGLKASVLEAKDLGFEGKGCIHPRQIRVVHEGFIPSAKGVQKAIKVVRAFEEARAKGLGVISLGSKMIDPPVVKRALRSVKLAVASGVLDKNWRKN